ncbi:MAG: helix-turn-helix transcriptional regulator [Bdellovibrionales bacterium]|jgi:DNA-binding transcriptional ArsR family regulator|nr:helix-turn-helix transcriptional regulator [Bdellovibrionales bacterium]MBT3525474.1 helix-turn-helix transcriptional regulator [Bdellovibrionales bacterium]MBT7669958.1 helix-turn-helix transcriptional regulator [Bdellovibrionales bacterium]MBT7768093.1 helix-turn-helix transcriptional regulator [Bdellovibrionales bacterium]
MSYKNQCDQMASFFSLFSNPLRLHILCELRDGVEKNVNTLSAAVGKSKHNVSQQLKLLRLLNIINQRKDGRFVYCQMKQPELFKAMEEISKVLRDNNISATLPTNDNNNEKF